MRKSLLLCIVAVALSIGNALEARAAYYDVVVDNVNYRISTDSIDEQHRTGYAYVRGLADQAVQDLVIKGYIDYQDTTYHVKSIQGSAFYNNDNIRTVTIEEGLEEIGQNAFDDCDNLQSVVLPSTVYSLGERTFYSCDALTTVNLPEGMTELRSETFRSCYALSNIVLPQSLTTIRNTAFRNCGLIEVVIPANVTIIEGDAFDCASLTSLICEAVVPPTIDYYTFHENLRTVTVPKGSAEAYYNAAYWNQKIIINGEPLHMTLDVQTPGGLADMILTQTENFRDVNELTVTGSLNAEDLSTISSRLTGMYALDMGGTDVKAIPNNFMNSRSYLETIVLPSQLESIGSQAFDDCKVLGNVVLPQTLAQMGNYAFSSCTAMTEIEIPGSLSAIPSQAFEGCSNLRKVTFNEGLTSIGSSAFQDCTNIENLAFPSTLRFIDSWAFGYLQRITSVVVNEGVTRLGGAVFYDCNNLLKIELPSTLTDCGDVFSNCDNITELVCKAAVPPVTNWNNGCSATLYVPQLLINEYKQAEGWDSFTNIKPIEGYEPDNINIMPRVCVNFLSDARPTNTPDLTIHADFTNSTNTGGRMSVEKGDVFSVHYFTMQTDRDYYYLSATGNERENNNSALLTNTQMRADSVFNYMALYNDQWHFVSFPYDVKVSEIEVSSDTRWVIRKYAGENRAAGLMDTTWVDLTADSVMHANEGYIIMTNRDDNYYPVFSFMAQNNTNKNNIFSTGAVEIALKEYQSEFAHNRSWNLIGNPYPCFYDTRRMDFNAPFTVWNGYGYTAYSTIDDAYILQPFEAFFVQRPVDSSSITFNPEGRQLTSAVTEIQPAAYVSAAKAVKRSVINLTLGDETYTDKARVVINEDAAKAYEMTRDASKFMSSNTSVPQLYSVEADGNYAINERPMGDGKVALGTYFGKAGTYTLALGSVIGGNVTLIDLYEDKTCSLNAGAYTFTAEQGSYNDRFVLDLVGTPTGVDGLVGDLDGVNVSVSDGTITVGNAANATVEVYTVGGSLVGKADTTTAEFNVAGGVYIIKVGGKSYKVVVAD